MREAPLAAADGTRPAPAVRTTPNACTHPTNFCNALGGLESNGLELGLVHRRSRRCKRGSWSGCRRRRRRHLLLLLCRRWLLGAGSAHRLNAQPVGGCHALGRLIHVVAKAALALLQLPLPQLALPLPLLALPLALLLLQGAR